MSEFGRAIPLIPLRDACVFPGMIFNFDIGREKSIAALEAAMISDQLICIGIQKNGDTDLPTRADFYEFATIAKVKQMLKTNGNNIRLLVEGRSRVEIDEFVTEEPYFSVRVFEFEETEYSENNPHIEALIRVVRENFKRYAKVVKGITDDSSQVIEQVSGAGRLADVIASNIDIKLSEKYQILSTLSTDTRLAMVNEFLVREIEIAQLEQDINTKVKGRLAKHQREYYLREQVKTIQDELHEPVDTNDDDISDWRDKLDDLQLDDKLHTKIDKEITRFSKIQPFSPESTVIRSYLEWVFDLPWKHYSDDEIDLDIAKKVLDEDHYGLQKVKDRVIEYLAVMELTKDMKAPILCLVGPPGVGKTSIAKSIARCIGRSFVRMSLGGVRDEAEIRGHRRTYIGAIPGRIINGMKEAGTMNPVFLFDEIDKLGSDYRGDPSSALLEVLDPEQNKEFTDHYLEFPFDLSKVMFITTANSLDGIPHPLLDRMEVIEVQGYTEPEKVNIAKQYLIPKQLKEHGIDNSDCQVGFSEQGLRDIINFYTRESGVRQLEREIAGVLRKLARKIVRDKPKQIKVTDTSLEKYLGKKRYRYDVIEDKALVGVVTGLAWTAVGGTTLSIETVALSGTGTISLTGQLGEVMKESAGAGMSYIRSIAKDLQIKEDFYKNQDIHIHIPEGATPKDGPSAGVSMFTSMVSALSSKAVRGDVAMTGEITLRGNVLPVGGIREKVLAAHRAGIKKVLLPKANEKDLEEIPTKVQKEMDFVLIDHAKEALGHALVEE